MEEIWKDIKGFEGRYQISNYGNVKSLRYCGRNEIRNLVPKVNNKGYEWVELIVNGKKNYRQIHRLVAEAFIPNTNNDPIVNHKDENPRNNRVDNLEWCDYKYNSRYYINLHRNDPNNKSFIGRASGTFGAYKHKRPIAQIDKDGNIVKVWDYVEQVARIGKMSSSSVIRCCNGQRKTAYGYTWHYVDAI